MRILFVTPYPPSRVRVRSYGFLTQLRRNHEVTIVALCRSERELADVEALRSQGHNVVMVYEPRWQAILRTGQALASIRSLHATYARSTRFIQALRTLCTQCHFDIVHVEHLRGIVAMESMVDVYPLVWDAVDCISLLYKQTIIAGPSLSMRAVAMLEHRRTECYEAKILNKLQHVVVTSERDRQALIDLSVQASEVMSDDTHVSATMNVLPNGVDLEYFRPVGAALAGGQRRSFNLVFSGKMNYHPNVATALYLYQQIMPLIWQRQPEVTLTIVGAEPTKEIQCLASDLRVEVTGYVDDIRPYIRRAEAMLCPMVYGTGIQNKVLEAMALGTPVIVTRQVAEALEVCPGRDLLVAESPQKFAEAALYLLDDANLRATLSRNGRAYVEQHHDWRDVTDRLVSVYERVIDYHLRKREHAFRY